MLNVVNTLPASWRAWLRLRMRRCWMWLEEPWRKVLLVSSLCIASGTFLCTQVCVFTHALDAHTPVHQYEPVIGIWHLFSLCPSPPDIYIFFLLSSTLCHPYLFRPWFGQVGKIWPQSTPWCQNVWSWHTTQGAMFNDVSFWPWEYWHSTPRGPNTGDPFKGMCMVFFSKESLRMYYYYFFFHVLFL